VASKVENNGVGVEAESADRDRMPRSVQIGLFVLLGLIISGSLYLVAVRGDALLADLAAVAALICG
jgi:hypothetical protein